MSKVTRRKHVMKETIWNDDALPKENQTVVKVVKSLGNNLHEVHTPNGDSYIVSMPTKFRKNVWIKRRDFVLVEPILEGNKVKAEIVKIMNKESIEHFKKNNIWPEEFNCVEKERVKNDDDLFINTNRY